MKKRIALFLFALSLHAATYYVASSSSTPAGNDSNNGSSGAPWRTYQHAFDSMATGDTLIHVADGNRVNCDATFPTSKTNITIQSSALASFQPIGYRTNPATDSSFYGKCTQASGVLWDPERHGVGGSVVASISGVTITLGYSVSNTNLANGSQVFWEINNAANLGALTIPSPFALFTKYYVKNCSGACGTSGSTLELAATPGGTSITPGSCTGTCILGATQFGTGVTVTAGSSTLVSPEAFVNWANGTTVTVSSVGLQAFGTLPAGFLTDTIYYVVNKGTGGAKNFGLSLSLGGTPITPTDVGTGSFIVAETAHPQNWTFRGIEFYSPTNPIQLLQLGSEQTTSYLGAFDGAEVDRSYFHGDTANCPSGGPTRGIVENGRNVYIHDSYFAEFCTGEGQAIVTYASFGPTRITNTFLEAGAENTMSGGASSSSGTANLNRTFTHNFYYKPPVWKRTHDCGGTPCTGAPNGSAYCLYDTTDPNNSGGEYYWDAGGSQLYQCGSDHLFHTVAGAIPPDFTIKNMAEYKNGSYHTYDSNVFMYSWVGGQSGQAIAMHQGEDSGAGRANDHATVTNNKVLYANQFITQQSHCNTTTIYCAVYPNTRNVTNNLAVLSSASCGVTGVSGSCGYPMHHTNMDGYPSPNDTHNHNTVVMPDNATSLPHGAQFFLDSTSTGGVGCPPAWGLIDHYTFENNITNTDLTSDCSFSGGAAIANFFSNALFTHNASVGSTLNYSSPGSGNTFNFFATPANNAAVGFVDAANGDWHLSSSSLYSAANPSATLLSTDGTDLGADVDLVNWKTSGVIEGFPTWDVRMNYSIAVGTTTVTVTYDRPGSTACSLTLYDHPARITANEDADTNSSGNKLDTRTGNTVSSSHVTFVLGTVAPLTPSTTYWPKLSCVAADTSTWLIAGESFVTAGVTPPATRTPGNGRYFSGARH